MRAPTSILEKRGGCFICHGTIAMVPAITDAQNFVFALESGKQPTAPANRIYKGYQVTAFTDAEEEQAKGFLGGGQERNRRPRSRFRPEPTVGQGSRRVFTFTCKKTAHLRDDELDTRAANQQGDLSKTLSSQY
ncbi:MULTISPECIES: hypothetical protein [unclassified Pseudomonas]|uniref:hypothetical protein n=1 Tax=unclassified Pseudomonas TaxID=196821 RepID=UPI002114AD4B|nr:MULTISPECIES: hypothetical protein [unclassified Pseudomonas]